MPRSQQSESSSGSRLGINGPTTGLVRGAATAGSAGATVGAHHQNRNRNGDANGAAGAGSVPSRVIRKSSRSTRGLNTANTHLETPSPDLSKQPKKKLPVASVPRGVTRIRSTNHTGMAWHGTSTSGHWGTELYHAHLVQILKSLSDRLEPPSESH